MVEIRKVSLHHRLNNSIIKSMVYTHLMPVIFDFVCKSAVIDIFGDFSYEKSICVL